MKRPNAGRERQGRHGAASERKSSKDGGWLLFFYTVPSKPVNNRMKIWRKMAKMGAVQLKGSVYILPYGEEHSEMLQWLVSEVASMGGEGAYIRAARIESMEDAEVLDLFNRDRQKHYQAVAKGVDELETKVSSIKKGSSAKSRAIAARLDKLAREFGEVRKIDFFSSPAGASLKDRLDVLRKEIDALGGYETEKPQAEISLRDIDDYLGKTWLTRPKPFVDRMAAAWLVRRFVDREVAFGFAEDKDLRLRSEDAITFDVRGGDFTHVADMCTFEVLLKSFGLDDSALRKIAKIVHELDLKDGKFDSPESKGVEVILMGIRKTAKDDAEMLEQGIRLFDMLYVSLI